MFDDILGPRVKKPTVAGKGIGAVPQSVGGVDAPEGMDPTKKQINPLRGGPIGPPPSTGNIPTPTTTAIEDDDDDLMDDYEDEFDDDEDECDGCDDDDCNCDGNCGDECCGGCSQSDGDIWSTN